MDVKELNKSQLILLAILLSFITSIATGITTVSLMQQAPKSIMVPINRVVQQTVEKIVPGADKVQTVVVKEEDLVVDAIAKNQSAVFSITKEVFSSTEGKVVEVSAGHGFVLSKDGVIATDALLVPGQETYYVTNSSGKFKADFVSVNKDGFAFLKIGAPVDPKDKISFTLPTFGDISKMKVGQKIIVLGSSVSSFIFDGSPEIKISNAKSNPGGLVLDLDGEVLGMALSGDLSSFVPISQLEAALK